jgi:hypothetical protein
MDSVEVGDRVVVKIGAWNEKLGTVTKLIGDGSAFVQVRVDGDDDVQDGMLTMAQTSLLKPAPEPV